MPDPHVMTIQLSAALAQGDEDSLDWALERLRSAAAGLPDGTVRTNVRIGRLDEFSDVPAEVAARGPHNAEAFAIWTQGDVTTLAGGGRRGLIYAITELTDRLRLAPEDGLRATKITYERPSVALRTVARSVSNVATDRAWFLDEQFWSDYLDMLVDSRFNCFALALGMQYNNPSQHNLMGDTYMCCAYPFFVDVPGYGVRVTEISAAEQRRNLEMLAFISHEAQRRGLDFRLGLWTQYYEFETVPNANFNVTGMTHDNRNGYCAEALALILQACPGITGMTFRIHSESGVADGDFDFWRGIFGAMANAGRPVDVDMHSKGLDQSILDLVREAGIAMSVSPKYIGEHMALPYHPAAIRVRDRTPRKPAGPGQHLTHGTRAFTRYSYGDFLPAKRDWDVVFRIWPGSQRLLMWADPEMAAGYGRHAGLCGAKGVEFCEPLTYYGRMGPAIAGGRQGYIDASLSTPVDWHKYAYQYRVWGRLLYCPDADPEGWRRYLRRHCLDAAEICESALATASRVLPLVTQTHGVSVSNHAYWPEIYTNYSALDGSQVRPNGSDMATPLRFGNVPTFDPQLFCNPREYVAELLSGEASSRYNPLEVAEWLEELAQSTEIDLIRLKARKGNSGAEARRIAADAGIQAAIGRFFAQKYRSACWTELFYASAYHPALFEAVAALRSALTAWEEVCAIAERCYAGDLPYGSPHFLRGSWSSRLPGIREELADMISLLDGDWPKLETKPARLDQALAGLAAPRRVTGSNAMIAAPAEFQRGQPLVIELADPGDADTGAFVLHYRHVNQGTGWQEIAFDGQGTPKATIAAEYTDSAFNLQFYVAARRASGDIVLQPGLDRNLSNQPYYVCLQADQQTKAAA